MACEHFLVSYSLCCSTPFVFHVALNAVAWVDRMDGACTCQDGDMTDACEADVTFGDHAKTSLP